MSETTYNGDDLLQVFKVLNIDLGNLNANVVRAWFDTEDENMLNFLNFMCSSISKENVLSALELQEFEALENPLFETELNDAINKLEEENPGLFDSELNQQQVRISSVQLELLEEEEQRLDNLIAINERLQQNLVRTKSCLEEENIALDFKITNTRKKGEELAEMLDQKNMCLYEKLVKELSSLSNFLFNEKEFLDRANLGDFEDTNEFHNKINDVVCKQREVLSVDFSESKINMNSTPDNAKSDLKTFGSQIYSSYFDYLQFKVEEESLEEVLNYLDNFFINDYSMKYNKNYNIETTFNTKGERKTLLDMMKKIATIVSEQPINAIELRIAEEKLKSMEDNLVCFSQISKCCTKVLSLTSCALMFFFEEKRCVEESDKLIKHISRYILNNLKDSKERSELMLDDIGKYNEHKQIPLEHRNEFIRIIMNLFNGNMLTEAYSSCNEIEKKLKTLEKENFLNNLTELPDIVDKVFKHDTLKKYLNSGPTRRMVVIPHKIQKSLKNIRFNLDKQTSVIKFLLQITNHTAKKLSSDKCLKNFRLLWIYFLVAPDKLQQALEEIREESKAEAIKTVRFKE